MNDAIQVARSAIRNAQGEVVGYVIAHDDGRIEYPQGFSHLPTGVYSFDPIQIPGNASKLREVKDA